MNFDPQRGMKGHFDFGVRVADRAGHVDKAEVQIYLLREDQRVRFVMRNQVSREEPRGTQVWQVCGGGGGPAFCDHPWEVTQPISLARI